MTTTERLPIRPYARLLTMLGEQLIKNDRIALVELVKNSYDADATQVVVALDDFGPDLNQSDSSSLSLTDNGDGMTGSVVRTAWLNPATSLKIQRKRAQARTLGGRIIQGEKGIGRFAIFKLGARVRLITRSAEEPWETVVDYDIRFLDELEPDAQSYSANDTYLDELQVEVSTRAPQVFTGQNEVGLHSEHGTRLEIRSLRTTWTTGLIRACYQEVLRLQPLTGLLTGPAGVDRLPFSVDFTVDGVEPEGLDDSEALIASLADQAVLRVVGSFDSSVGQFRTTVNDHDRIVALSDPHITGLRLFREYFDGRDTARELTCGNFEFEFLIFDLRPSADAKHRLDPDQKALVKSHRIYLYRDGLRVLPYGDPDDDWLQLDVIRGTQGASRIFSNDQTLGFIYISQEENPLLRDKTNREGLIDSGRAYSDFRVAIQLFVTYLRRSDFAQYLAVAARRDAAEAQKQKDSIALDLQALRAESGNDARISRRIASIERAYDVQTRFMNERVRRTEDLAGVGLSVETASHDIIAAAGHALRDSRLLQEEIQFELGLSSIAYGRASGVVDSLSFITSRLQDVQGLFVSTRQRPRVLNVVQYAQKIEAIYSRLLRDRQISVDYRGDPRVEIRTVDATLLQVFLNLMDNAVYWLSEHDLQDRRIEVWASSSESVVTFSDNGPGVDPADEPFIFDAFYSGKGDEGRGLGLYIAREVARRSGFELELLPNSESRLGGASFRFSFGGS